MRSRGAVLAALLAISCSGRGALEASPTVHTNAARPGERRECAMPGWDDRGFTLEVPRSWNGASPLPLVVAFHGGGGNRGAAESVTCPGGDRASAGCLSAVALAAGFAVVRPDGTGSRLLARLRTWNAGGGKDGWNCTSGRACKDGVDDVRYFDALLVEIGKQIPIDPKRIHATGLSNGAAMSHRLACERADRIASIVAVGGSNQHAATGGACAGGVPVLEIHGTEDPCWTYATSSEACLGDGGKKVGVAESMEGWRLRNGCSAETDETPLADRDPSDGTHATLVRWRGCRASVELVRVDGGGHTWPNGDPYFSERRIGRVTHDFGSEVVIDFFRAHAK
ncbi:MAG TPA: hypothetical protein VIF62_31215 [Labilithrix sp.]